MWYVDNNRKRQDFYKDPLERKKELMPASMNIYQDIAMMMKAVQFIIDLSYQKDRVELHSHDAFYELIHVTSGNVQYILDERRLDVRPGDLIWIPPSTAHCPVLNDLDGRQPYERQVMWVDRTFVQSLRTSAEHSLDFLDESAVMTLSGEDDERLSQLMLSGYNAQKAEGGLSLLERKIQASHVIFLLSSLLLAPREKKSPRQEVFDRVNGYISQNLSGDLSIEVLCSQACLSRQALGSLFVNTTGMNVHQWVTKRRIMYARSLMAEGALPSQVWQDCGFQDYSGFYRAFTKIYGICPKDYVAIGAK